MKSSASEPGLTISLFSAFKRLSLGNSLKVGDERSTCVEPTVFFLKSYSMILV